MTSRLRDDRGMTLVEVAVVGALIIVVLLPLLRFFDSAVTDAAAVQQSTQVQADGRFVVDRLARELRQAYTGTDALPAAAVTTDGLGLRFYSPDTGTPFRLRRIDYRVQDGMLQRAVAWSTQTSCPDTATDCSAYGPPWTFVADGPWVDVLAVQQTRAFSPVVVDGAVRRVDISFAGIDPGHPDRPYETSIEMRNA